MLRLLLVRKLGDDYRADEIERLLATRDTEEAWTQIQAMLA